MGSESTILLVVKCWTDHPEILYSVLVTTTQKRSEVLERVQRRATQMVKGLEAKAIKNSEKIKSKEEKANRSMITVF